MNVTPGTHSGPATLHRWAVPVLGAVALLGVLVWGPTLYFDFTYDDHGIVVANEMVEQFDLGGMLTSTLRDGSTEEPEYGVQDFLYRPVTRLSFALNHLISGGRPWSYHLVNVVLHFLAAGLAFALLRRLGAVLPVAAAAAAFFLLHPVHVESVANVKNREEILAALGVLAAWLMAERGWAVPAGPRRSARFGLAGLLLWLGLLSKESAVCALALIPLADLGREGRPRSWRLRLYAGLGTACAAWLVLRTIAIGPIATQGLDVFFTPGEGWWTRLLTSAQVWARFYFARGLVLGKCPIDFSSRCVVPVEHGWPSPAAVVGLTLLGLSAGGAVWAWRRGRRDVALAAAAFWIALFPTSNLLVPIGSVGAYRFLYLPSLAWGVLLGAGGWWLAGRFLAEPRRTFVFWTAVLVAAGAWAAQSRIEARNWRDDDAINRSNLVSTSNPAARYVMATAASSPAERERWLREVVAIMERVPGSGRGMETTLLAKTYHDLAEMALQRGNLQEAETLARKSIAVLEPDARYHKYRVFPLALEARLALARGDRAAEIASWESCLRADPLFPDAYVGLARALARQGKRAEADEVLNRGIRALRAENDAGLDRHALALEAERARLRR